MSDGSSYVGSSDLLDQSCTAGGPVWRVWEAHDRLALRRERRQRLAGSGAPGSIVALLEPWGPGLVAHGVDFLGAAVAVIGGSVGQHGGDDFAVAVHAPHMVERAFVGLHAQTGHAVQSGLDGLRGGNVPVGIFDAQNENPLVFGGVGT